MKFNVEFEDMVTHKKWIVEIDAVDEDRASEACEEVCKQFSQLVMFEIRPFC